MTTFGRKALRLVAAASAVPVLALPAALRLKPVLAEDDTSAELLAKKTVYRVFELPLHDHIDREQVFPKPEPYPRNAVEESLAVAHTNLSEMGSIFMDQCSVVSDKVNIGFEHSKASLDLIQNNPGELPRIFFICVAGMGGVVLGNRGGVLRKLFYSSVAGMSAAALCYPRTTVAATQAVVQEMEDLWVDIGGRDLVDQYWPSFGGDNTEELAVPELVSSPNVRASVAEDEGQSNPEDKDLYSTRGS